MPNSLRNIIGRLISIVQGGVKQGNEVQGGITNPQYDQSTIQLGNSLNPQSLQGSIGLQGGFVGPDTSYSGGNDATAGIRVNNNQPQLMRGVPWAGNFDPYNAPKFDAGNMFGHEPLYAQQISPQFDTTARPTLQQVPISKR